MYVFWVIFWKCGKQGKSEVIVKGIGIVSGRSGKKSRWEFCKTQGTAKDRLGLHN